LNTPASVNKDLNFQGTWAGGDVNVLYWQFDTDGNVIIEGSARNVFLNDDFEDEDISDWNVINGAWTAAGGNLIQTAGGNNEISFDTGSDNNWSASGLEINFDVNATNVAVSVLDTNFTGSGNGYRFTTGAGEFKIQTVVSGSTGDIAAQAVGVNAGDTMQITIDINGLIRMSLNGGNILDVVDTNFSAFRFVNVDASINAGLQDINVLNINTTGTLIESGASQTHTFTTGGQKTIQLTAQNSDGNASTSLDINVTGSLNITVWDENKDVVIDGATIDFNSGTYTTDASGKVNIPLVDLTASEFTISVDVNADFPQRQFIFDLNEFSVEDLNLLMLESVPGAVRSYTIFQPDKVTRITNSMVEWRRVGTIVNGISQRTRTDSSAVVSFLGQQDANYVMRITDEVAGGIQRDYNGTLVTFLIPRNEVEVTQTLTPFDLQVGGLAQQTFSNLSASQTFLIFSDTTDFYDVLVDFNSDFYSRNYSVKTTGGQATLEVQPFLLPTSEGIQIKVILRNSNSLRPIQRALITSQIGSVLLESISTDDGGEGQMSFRVGTPYELRFFIDNVQVNFLPTSEFALYNPKSSDTQLKINLNISDTNVGSTVQVSSSVAFNPTGGMIVDGGSGFDLNQTITVNNSTVSQVNTLVKQGSTTLSDTNVTTTFINETIPSASVGTTEPIIVTTTVTTASEQTFEFTQRYTVSKQFSFLTSLANIKNDELGEFGAIIFALFISMGVMIFAYVAIQSFTTDPAPSFAIGLIALGMFSVIAYVPVWLWWISAIGGTAVYVRQRRF
jgi:hypothetical protein|tara:strand:+ start:3130 stop:5493 length:2364 start_codon:yes stop_codon:yes gene_type:complete